MSEAMTTQAVANPYLQQPSTRRVLTLVGVYLTFFLVIADASGYPVLLPSAIAQIGGQEYYALAQSIGGLLAVVAMPFLGYLSARNPHLRPALLASTLLIVAVAVVVRGLAPNVGVLMVGGALASLGTASSYVIGLPLVRDMFPVQRASVLLGVVGTSSAIGQILGPIVISGIVQGAGWRAVAFFIAPAMVVAAALVLLGARVTRAQTIAIATRHGRFDAPGAVLLTALVAFLLLPLSLGTGVLPYGSVGNTVCFLIALVALIGFVAVVRKKKDAAYMPAAVFRDRNSLALIIQTFLSTGSALVVYAFVPLYILEVMHQPPVTAGLAGALFAVPGFFLSPFIGRWIGRAGSAAGVIYAGTAFKVVVMVVLGVMMLVAPASISIVTIYVAMFLAGVYNATATVTVQVAPQVMLRPKIRAQGTAAVSVQLVLGPILGAAAFGGIVVGFGPATGVAVAILAASVAAALAIVPTLFFRPLTGADSVEVAEAREESIEATSAGAEHAPVVSAPH